MLILHKVQEGDTVETIAEQYRIPVHWLEEDNVITPDNRKLNVGQIIVVAYPEKTYFVKEGDTLSSIAKANGVTVMELLRNNPFLSDRAYLEVGEELVISYDREGKKMRVNGMTFSFISENVLRKTLPFLTFITVMGYQVDAEANLRNVEDEFIIKLAIDYGVVPLMLVYTLNETGVGSFDITHTIFNSQELERRLVDNIITVIKAKGYYGAVLGFQYVLEEDLSLYANFIEYASERLQTAGYSLGAVLIPSTFGYAEERPYEESYFSEIGQFVDSAILLSYQWATGYIPNTLQTSYLFLKGYLDVVITQIPHEKIYLGISRIAYNWELPYVEGESMASAISDPEALALAGQYNSEIFYDEDTKFSYFLYDLAGMEHLVWFGDARQLNAIFELVEKYDLGGIAVWNIMRYFRIWFMINAQYEIEKLLPVE
ncbi:MAG TPA: LysM peptidoglycan-binding domain-containing protein [Clostridiales bacterium]|nr:LysM peptidoglycan-binding domain-containing protein [Clostridiales bacterium]